jgi:hypothetical protein
MVANKYPGNFFMQLVLKRITYRPDGRNIRQPKKLEDLLVVPTAQISNIILQYFKQLYEKLNEKIHE